MKEEYNDAGIPIGDATPYKNGASLVITLIDPIKKSIKNGIPLKTFIKKYEDGTIDITFRKHAGQEIPAIPGNNKPIMQEG